MDGSRTFFFLAALSLVLLLGGCRVGPDFDQANVRPGMASSFANELPAPENDPTAEAVVWWETINDPYLKKLVEELETENLDLQQAAERLFQAHERLRIEAGARLPAISGSGEASRSFGPSSTPGRDRAYQNQYGAGLDLAWQVDLFGRIRRSIESAEARFEATAADRDAIYQSLIAELARLRIDLSVSDRQINLAVANLQNRRSLLQTVERRYELGTTNAPLSEVYLAEEAVSRIEAELASLRRSRSDQSYRLDVLLGSPPGSPEAGLPPFPLMAGLPQLSESVPAALLDQRPDLRADALRLEAANADIGIAIADLYPDLTLPAGAGLSSATTADFFNSESLTGSLAASLTQTLFRGGSLRANIRLQESEYRELELAYRQTILNALLEVESALQAERRYRSELAALDRSVASLQKAEQLAAERYQTGLQSLQSFLEIQSNRYQAEQNRLQLMRRIWTNRIGLYLALGGKIAGGPAPAAPLGASLTNQTTEP